MSGILDLLNSKAGKAIINGVSQQTNQPEGKTQDVLTMALPVLMQAMKRNAQTPQGAEGLMNALGNNKHDGSILDNLDGLFSGGVDAGVLNDGSKILGHVLGNKEQNVTNALGAKSGLDAGAVSEILKVAAPILLGFLGKQTRQQNVNSSSGLESLLGGLLQGNSPKQEQSFLEAILDADGDGSVIDDVAGMVLGGNKKKGGLGGLLGGFLGKK
ncbi:hypothetical protein IA57_11570 [Mangrovimonas yunxiaonensis]|uniref:DUF937 domain-containing protein n=1 Tax=Mangrovimonas yunxiaonensis TaxID=1197477 RepID=A0A084THY5_9FLAO|nr:DUF937 domain-containing protein [Mangrovimonas yunxiaonensis]KFB00321.1 hypothetical protein IA57_11570 [Mangrovimonas yunxiaonensis]GGH41707.1 hypothetical protein GCM10011364_12680 [Mangrovimonas yunxiaonensis]